MKTSKLIEVLQEKLKSHGDLDVEITWESTTRIIDQSSIYLSKSGELYIDADDNVYKYMFAVDPNEGENENQPIEISYCKKIGGSSGGET